MTDKRIVLTTCGSDVDAERIARTLVERRLAACVNIIGGVRSIYRWKDAVEDDAELLLVIKTQTSAIEALKTALAETHPYDVPELVVIQIEDGAAAYLSWIASNVD
ncbi:MAG: divalent-cation tolerance protein CutA [Bryobacterales bacterium]